VETKYLRARAHLAAASLHRRLDSLIIRGHNCNSPLQYSVRTPAKASLGSEGHEREMMRIVTGEHAPLPALPPSQHQMGVNCERHTSRSSV
jgi:hypothetical protein